MLYTLCFFSLQNAVCFIMLTCLVPVLFPFYIQGVLKLKKNNSGAKELTTFSLFFRIRDVHCRVNGNDVLVGTRRTLLGFNDELFKKTNLLLTSHLYFFMYFNGWHTWQ